MKIAQRCHDCGHEWKGKIGNSRRCPECHAGEKMVSLRPPRSKNKDKYSTLRKLSEHSIGGKKVVYSFPLKSTDPYLNLDFYANKMMHARWYRKLNGRGSSPETFMMFDGEIWGLEFKANTGISPTSTKSLKKKQRNTLNLINYLVDHKMEHEFDYSPIKLMVVIGNEHNKPILGKDYKIIGINEFNKYMDEGRVKPLSIYGLKQINFKPLHKKALEIKKHKEEKHAL